jgi:ABC-type glycerol-3-phosphate transport system substrate-binding protein
MQLKSKRHRLLFCLLGPMLATAGCRPTPEPIEAPAAPYQGTELRIACPTEATAALLRGPGQAWALRQGVKIHLLRYDLAAGPEAAGPADVWIIPPADLPRWAAAGRLAAMPAAYSTRENAYAWTDLLPTYRELLLLWEGTPHGLPLVGESLLCCYRKDRFDDTMKAAFRKQFGRSFDAPATWEQFAWIAEYCRDHGSGGRPAPSLPPLPRADTDLDRLFYTVAAGFARRVVPADEASRVRQENDVFSFHYDVTTGQPRIAAPGFVQALKLLQRLQACRPAEPADAPEEAFRTGGAVLCLSDAPWLKMFEKTPALRDKVGVCRVPGGERYFDFVTGTPHATPEGNRVPYLGGAGWLAVVPRGRDHEAAAFDLLADLSGPKTSTQIFLGSSGDGGPIRVGPLYRQRWDSFDVDTEEALHLQGALQETLLHRGLKNPALCLRTPRQAAHQAALVKEVRAALREGSDAEKALHRVEEAWKKLDRELGEPAHRADYRRSLGLLAK